MALPKTTWINGETYNPADANLLATKVNRIVTPEDFGAVGDGTTDDTAALNTMFNSYTVSNGGSCILIPYGQVYATAAIDIKSNTFVFGGGTLKMLYNGGVATGPFPGVFLTFKGGVNNVTWVGPTLDINHKVNVNGFDIGQDNPAPTDWCASNIYIAATVKGGRIDTTLEDSSNRLFAGGGKGIAIGQAARNVYANIRALDCDIGASIETNSGIHDIVENVMLDIQANGSHRTALFINGCMETGYSGGSATSGDYMHAVHNGVKIRLRAQSGQDGSVTNPVTSVVGTNYDYVGVVTLDWASGVDLEIYAATPNRCTIVRGMASASTIRVTNALLDNMQDGWDTRPVTTLNPSGVFMGDNVFEANIHAATHSGVLVRPHRDTTNRTMVKSKLDVSVWCENGVGAITQSDGTTDEFGVSVAYRFRDIRSNPVREVVGDSSIKVLPTWSDVQHFNNLDIDALTADVIIPNTASTVTAGGTTTLTIASPQVQVFTGTSAQTVKLPTTGVKAGMPYTIVNNSTGVVFVQASNGSAIFSQFGGGVWVYTAKVDTASAPTDWQITSGKLNAASSGNTIMQRDSDGTVFANNFIPDTQSTATAAGTTTLGVSSPQIQVFTGTTTQTVKLPTSFVTAGQQYTIINNSTGTVTVQSSGANTITTVATITSKLFVAQKDSPTAAADWRAI